MTSQTHTDRVKDAAKKRLKYLSKKTGTGLLLGLLVVFACAPLVLSVFMGLVSISNGGGLLLLISGVLLSLAVRATKRVNYKYESMPYVPPIRKQLAEQIAHLPAEEILVRGSNEPAATSGELLRAAGQASETEPDELLRPMESRTA